MYLYETTGRRQRSEPSPTYTGSADCGARLPTCVIKWCFRDSWKANTWKYKRQAALVLKHKCKYLWRTWKLAILIVSFSVYHLIVDVNSRSLPLSQTSPQVDFSVSNDANFLVVFPLSSFYLTLSSTRSSNLCIKIPTTLTSRSASFPRCSSPCKRPAAGPSDPWARSGPSQTWAAVTIFCRSAGCLVSLTRKLSFAKHFIAQFIKIWGTQDIPTLMCKYSILKLRW